MQSLTKSSLEHKERTERIWRGLHERLRRFVRSRIRSEADVDDILQTVFMRLHAKIDNLREDDKLEPWLFQVTRNAITDFYRGGGTTATVDELVQAEDVEPSPVHELSGCLAAMVERLPKDQSQALTLYEFQGMKQADVARQLSLSLSGAKARIQRGRKALAELMKACCEFHFDSRGNILDFDPKDECCENRCGSREQSP